MRTYKETYRDYIRDSKHESTLLAIEPTHTQFKGSDLEEPTVCSVFGCNNHLSLEERRFGTTCIHHQKKKKLDITLFVSQSKIA